MTGEPARDAPRPRSPRQGAGAAVVSGSAAAADRVALQLVGAAPLELAPAHRLVPVLGAVPQVVVPARLAAPLAQVPADPVPGAAGGRPDGGSPPTGHRAGPSSVNVP